MSANWLGLKTIIPGIFCSPCPTTAVKRPRLSTEELNKVWARHQVDRGGPFCEEWLAELEEK